MTKAEIRKLYRQKRALLSSDEKERLNTGILKQFKKISLPSLHTIHSFISSEKLTEPDTSQLITFLKSRFPGLKITVPKVDKNNLKMENLLLENKNLLERNSFGIGEPVSGIHIDPEEIDLAIVPLLAFDSRGFRVGYGKGFYDRFFKECRKDVLKIGVSFFDPVEEIEDKDPFDIPLTHCCTPDNLYFW